MSESRAALPSAPSKRPPGRRPFVRRLAGWTSLAIGAALLIPLAVIVLYAAVPPPSTLVLGRWLTRQPVQQDWKPLADISPRLLAAVTASEDSRFCRHGGVDWDALREVMDDADDEDGPSRGASTLDMQVVKNVFLWPGRSYVRKALEIPLATVTTALWGKRRVLEIYLNIAEWGEGVFGAEAAAQRYFHRSASQLSEAQAALLATALPDPRRRNPAQPGRGHQALARTIEARARTMEPWLDCLKKG